LLEKSLSNLGKLSLNNAIEMWCNSFQNTIKDILVKTTPYKKVG
jgi:hypothetical protein